MQTVRALIVTNEELAVKAIEIFKGLVDNVVAVTVPHTKPLVEMCLEFANNKTLDEDIGVEALNFIGWLTTRKKRWDNLCQYARVFLFLDCVIDRVA
jgi:hypothetical protein